MPTVPCPNAINCLDAESPVANLSAEGPDEAKCFRYSFTDTSATVCEFPITLCEAFSDIGLDVGILCPPNPCAVPPCGPNPPPPVIYSSAAQACEVDCGDGTSETYTVVAGTFVALSQAEADANAFNFACQLAALLCDGPLPALFTNTAQSCTVNCPDQTTFTYTVPAGFFTALSQAEADANAYVFACAVAALLCSGLPPTGTTPGAGTDPEPPSQPLYSNYAQTCTSACANGSIFTYTAEGGLYQASSRDAANAIAYSYACAQANAQRFCLDNLPAAVCVGDFFFESVTTDGSPGPLIYSLVGGALPPGLFLASTGFLSGIPTTPGTSSFTIRATSANGSSDRTYSMAAIEITPDTLPDAENGTPYAEALSDAGTTGSVTWAIASGSLPTGLSLNPSTGVISGTPTVDGAFSFIVSVTDSLGTCEKALSITVESLAPAAWFTMESAGATLIDVVAGNNMARSGFSTGPAPGVAAGKVNLAISCATQLTDNYYATASVAALEVTGAEDINIFGWSYFDVIAGKTQTVLLLTSAAELLTITFLAAGTYSANFGALTGAYPAAGAFFFWRLHWDSVNQKIGVAINNAAPTYEAGNTVFSAAATALLQLTFTNVVTGVNAQKLDECCVFFGPMSQSAIDGIYNAGAGRTWP